MEKITNVSQYPEGLEILAEKMDLPMEDMEARKAFVKMIVGFVAGL